MRTFQLISKFVAAILLSCCLFACVSEEDKEVFVQDGTIRLTSEIASTSRVTDQSLQSNQIVEGQQVGVTITDAASEHANVAWLVGKNGSLANTGNKVNWGTTDVTIRAYHPYNDEWTDSFNIFSVNTDQSTEEGYLNSDLLWASTTASPTNAPVALSFAHKLSKINVTLTSSDIADLSNATITICGTSISAYFNSWTGEVWPSYDDADIKASVTTEGAYTASAIIIPQTVSQGTEFIKITLGDREFHYTLPEEQVFESGQTYNFTLNIKDWGVESTEPASEYQLFEVEKDGTDAIVTKNGQYAFLKETPNKDALMLVTGRCTEKEQTFVLFDAEGYLKSMAFDDYIITFFYTPNGVAVIGDDNEVLGEIPYSEFPEINNGGQTRVSDLTRNEFMQKLDFVCGVIDNINLVKDVGEAILKKALEAKVVIDLIRTTADLVKIPSNHIIDSVDALLGLVLDTNKLGRICESIDMKKDRDFLGYASVKSFTGIIKDKMKVDLACEVKDLSDKSLHRWAKREFGEIVDYSYTLGMNIYENPTTLTPVQTKGKTIVGDGKETFEFVVDKKYEKYYYEPYLKVEGTIKIDHDAVVCARVNIAPAYKEKLYNNSYSFDKFSRTIYGDREYFMHDYNLRQALIKLYESTDGENWNHGNAWWSDDNWCSDKPIIEWSGVMEPYMDDAPYRFSIDLNGHGLKGKIDQIFPDDVKFTLGVGNNKLTYVDVSGSTTLCGLDVSFMDTPITSLNASGCTSLERLSCMGNEQLISLDASGCNSLRILTCYDSKMSSLNVDGCTSLKEVNCYNNQLTSLDLSGYTSLEKVYCYANPLESLDVSGCSALYELNLYGYNNDKDAVKTLTSLNVDGCTSLRDLDCHNNQLTSLNVDGLTSLRELNFSNNQLTSLSVHDCASLSRLGWEGNPLTSMYFENCPSLDPGYSTHYSTHLDGIKLETLTFNNCIVNNGQSIFRGAEIKTIRFENINNLSRIFFESGHKSNYIEFVNCNFNGQGVSCSKDSQVATLCFNNCSVPDGRLDNANGNLVVKNSTIGDCWVIYGEPISISNTTIEGYSVSFSGSKEAFDEYWRKLTEGR